MSALAEPSAPTGSASGCRSRRWSSWSSWSASLQPVFLQPATLLAARRRHRGAVHPRDRRHLRHHARRHRPVDPVDGLAGERHRGADRRPARLRRVRRWRSASAPSPASLSGLAHVRLQDPVLHRDAGDGRRALQHRAGHLRRALDHARRGRARLPDLDHRHASSASRTSSSSASSCSSSPTSLQSRTPFGRYSAAIGAGEPAAYASGVKVDRQKVIAFVLSATLRGARRRHPGRPARQRLADAGSRTAAARRSPPSSSAAPPSPAASAASGARWSAR